MFALLIPSRVGEQMTASHFTEREADAILDFAANVGSTLGLPSWKLTILDEHPNEGAMASIEPIEGRWFAMLRLSPEWMELDSDKRRMAIVHEVCHLIHYDINNVIKDAAESMHGHEWQSLNRRYVRAVEYMVDHLAHFLDSHYDLKEAWEQFQNPITDIKEN